MYVRGRSWVLRARPVQSHLTVKTETVAQRPLTLPRQGPRLPGCLGGSQPCHVSHQLPLGIRFQALGQVPGQGRAGGRSFWGSGEGPSWEPGPPLEVYSLCKGA